MKERRRTLSPSLWLAKPCWRLRCSCTQELCRALEGSRHYRFLNATACPPLLGPPGPTDQAVPKKQPLARQQLQEAASANEAPCLLDSWCVPADKLATGWGALSDAECTRRLAAVQRKAVQAARTGGGMVLFKHVHKVGAGWAGKRLPAVSTPGAIARGVSVLMRRCALQTGGYCSVVQGAGRVPCLPCVLSSRSRAVQAGGSTMCELAQRNTAAESPLLPGRADWTTNCVPFEAFLGPHPAVGGGGARPSPQSSFTSPTASAADGAGIPAQGLAAAARARPAASRSASPPFGAQPSRRRLQAHWLGGACWVGFLTPPQLRAAPRHFAPLRFVASEGPLPDTVALDAPLAWVTMLRRPLDRVLSSYRWWQLMTRRWPQSPGVRLSAR